ncbi:hypothetical protein QJS10_CPB12g00822 [Acorus calamus]|uniref:Uncharacterized protein n=1 Tax=Acorus calamus TaxID=4465 RepID=A0AAV9DQ79_ACOCL|nr:hypothetical protein QJS10_CPB12g00822 [Acorus calamus]
MLDVLDNASIEMDEAKARLYDIITSEPKQLHNNGWAECPWMVDGAGLPPNASELLPKMEETVCGTRPDIQSFALGLMELRQFDDTPKCGHKHVL